MSTKHEYIFFLVFRVYIGACTPQRMKRAREPNQESPRASRTKKVRARAALSLTRRHFINKRPIRENFVKNFLVVYETKIRIIP